MNIENTYRDKTDDEMAEGMAEAMDGLRKGIEEESKRLEEQHQPPQPPALSELERFMASIDRQRELVRKRTLDRESSYQLNRAEVVNDFWLRFQHLQNELDETLRTIDVAHERQVASDSKLFAALDSARG